MATSIRSLDRDMLTEIIEGYGQPKYRAKQLYEWLHDHNATSYDEMSNLPKSLRSQLASDWPLESSRIADWSQSQDGSRKYLIELSDGAFVEAVGIIDKASEKQGNILHDGEPENQNDVRLTVCVSSQVGCAMACTFCATGSQGLQRNLTTDEIVDQVVLVGKDIGTRVDNVVMMGQGEPFQNYDAVIEAIRRMNSDKGLGIGARHITVSTAGITDGIYRFADEPEQFRLALSLHSADQDTRNSIMPRLSGQPLRKLKKALEFYNQEKGRRITIEYLLLNDVNDSLEQLERLVEFCQGLNVHVNLLPFNPIAQSSFKPSKQKTINEWAQRLNNSGIPTSIRHSRGQDIAGACGQLAGQHG